MNEIIGDCLALGIHNGYILAALGVTLTVIGLVILWLWLDRRQLVAAVFEQEAAQQRAATQESNRWL